MSEKVDLPGGLTYEILPKEEENKAKNEMRSLRRFKHLIKVKPPGILMCDSYLKVAHLIYNFKFRSDDVVVMAFPKTGSTWMEEIVWTMRHNPDLNNPKASELLSVRSAYLELDILDTPTAEVDQIESDSANGEPLLKRINPLGFHLRNLDDVPWEKRQMKTHLTFSFFAPSFLETCKVVSILRNPKDVLQSNYTFMKLMTLLDFHGDFETFADVFISDRMHLGGFWTHAQAVLEKKDHPNVCVLFYEDLLTNPEAEIRKLDKFLETKLSDKQIENVVQHTSFKKMKKRDEESENPLWRKFLKDEVFEEEGGFFRTGQVGSWKKYQLSDEMERRLSEWIEKNEEAVGIKFRYT